MLMCVFLLVFLNGYGVFHKVKKFSLNHVDIPFSFGSQEGKYMCRKGKYVVDREVE